MTMKSDAKFEKKLICCFNHEKNLVNLTRAPKSLKNLHFDWFFLCKVLMLGLKKYRGVIFHYTEEWWIIRRKTDLWLVKWHEEFGKFSAEHPKVSKLQLWWDPSVPSRTCMSLKFTEESCVITMKNDAKIWRGIDLSFQNWLDKLDNFWPVHLKM